MGNPRAFLTIHRQEAGYRPVEDRIDDFSEVEQTLNSSDRRRQASRCMDCGVPFCHWACHSEPNNRNGRTSFIKDNGVKPITYWNRPATFRNLPAASALPSAKKAAC